MRAFTMIAAAVAVVLGLSTAPAMADSFSFGYSSGSHYPQNYYGGSGYSQRYSRGYMYNKPYFGRYYSPRGYYGFNRFARPGFGNYGYRRYAYQPPRLSTRTLIIYLGRQRYSNIEFFGFSNGFHDVRARDCYGRKVKLTVDPYTGRIVAWRYRR